MVILHSYEIPIPMAEMSLDMKPGTSDEFEREANERIAHIRSEFPGCKLWRLPTRQRWRYWRRLFETLWKARKQI